MTKFTFQLVGAMEKILPDRQPRPLHAGVQRGFLGEKLSVQLAYTCENDDLGGSNCSFIPRLRTDAQTQTALRRVELVPCGYPCHGTRDADYLVTTAGMYPDLLRPLRQDTPVKAIAAQWRALWLDVTAAAGTHTITIELFTPDGVCLERLSFAVEVLGMQLPEQTLLHTQWFHADCLANYYHVPVFSEAHWNYIDNFMRSAAEHGVNMLLTPIFTPPLDTAKGGERTTVQLVGVTRTDGCYSFDFSLLRRWIALCEKNGIRELELSHLFSQWGAACAPKVIACVDGTQMRLFGWETPAVGGEYTRFLHAFLPALKRFLAECGWLEHTWFHISDEPSEEQLPSFAAARDSVRELLDGCRVIDALSSYEFYRRGLVTRPVVSVDHIEPFIRCKVPHLWAYYCTGQAVQVPNRFIAMTSSRNRILGVLLYYFRIEGFLHWGFNFYNSQYSLEHIDPYRVTDAGEGFPSGDPFLVYPAPDGTAYESIRGAVLQKALCDLRALELLEARRGRAWVMQLLDTLAGEPLSFSRYPRSADFFDRLREAMAQELATD